ncbi:splicing factor 3A subunit 3-like protein [Sarcoptes scabiei]|nr:splicing factor 3A subunit 3-like protein [Sarcoptes scabiei]
MKKFHQGYTKYLESLIDYLDHYITRSKPLLPKKDIIEKLKDDFEKMWDRHQVPGWSKETGGVLSTTGAPLDLQAFNSWEELSSLGLNRLKSALIALGMKCGGTLEERAKRLWATRDKNLDEIDSKLFSKPKNSSVDSERQKEIAFMEVLIYKYLDILDEQRQATKENVQRKQARTAGEREESDDEAEESEPEDDDETDVIYNPKNLPLGWDGKPIPYWLYKLHGLNISYSCEICGNAIYKGPKAFQKHFAEWRHAHGMRCLGIPNTAHFANVTKIEDALALWEKLKNEKHKEKFQPTNEEEYEDSLGNVVNKKTYEDLKRQGLL